MMKAPIIRALAPGGALRRRLRDPDRNREDQGRRSAA